MNPQQDQTPGLPLPQPSYGAAPVPAGMPSPTMYQAPQQGMPPMQPDMTQPSMGAPMPAGPTMPGQVPDMQMQQPAAINPAMPQAQPGAMPTPSMPTSPLTAEAAASAGGPESEDALDQEWIAKAREIVLRTHADPYLQSKELSKIKAQYIKVRYNKDIKTDEE
jgi:hypothetical protein